MNYGLLCSGCNRHWLTGNYMFRCPVCKTTTSKQSGYTLSELLFLVVVAGITVTIGYVIIHFIQKFW